jgi:hypothetical protein
MLAIKWRWTSLSQIPGAIGGMYISSMNCAKTRLNGKNHFYSHGIFAENRSNPTSVHEKEN